VRVGLVTLVNVAVGLAAAVGVAVRVTLAVTVNVRVGVSVCVGGVGTALLVGVGDAVRDAVALRVAVLLGRWVPVSVAAGVAVVVGTWLLVAVGLGGSVGGTVELGATVAVVVTLAVGVAVAVGRGVTVTSGWFPMRRMNCCNGPGLPATSSTRAVTMLSPPGNASTVETGKQNCTRVLESMKLCWPNSSIVHDAEPVEATDIRQLKSLSVEVTAGRSSNDGGAIAGTPPSPQISGLPSPSGRDDSIWMSGRPAGGSPSNSCPGGKPELPTIASTTTTNPKPPTAWYVRTGMSLAGWVARPSADAIPR